MLLVDEADVSVSLDVTSTEVEAAVVVCSVDELVGDVSMERLVELSETVDSLLASGKLWLVLVVEELVPEVFPVELISGVGLGGSVVVMEKVVFTEDDELVKGSCPPLEGLVDE
jgi:hypothetical protein